MANNVYGQRKMYSGGLIFLIIIPIGFIALIYLYDFIQGIYFQNQLDNAVKEVLNRTLDRDGLESYQEYREYALRTFTDMGFDTEDMSLITLEDGYILVNYKNYTSVVGELSFGLLRTKKIMVHSAYKGYYNEYKETVVEKYEEDLDDLILDEEEDDSFTSETIID